MAKVEQTSITITSTGSDTIVLEDYTLAIEKIIFAVSNSATSLSTGFSDGNSNFTGNVLYGDVSTTKSIIHYRNISGVKTKTFEAVVTNLDIGEFSISTTVCTQPTQLELTVYGS